MTPAAARPRRFTPARTPSSILRVAAVGIAALCLSGCAATDTGTPSPSGGDTQTVAQACATVRTSVQDAAAELQKLDPSDPKAAVDALGGVAAQLDEAARAVGNPQIAALLPPLQTGFASASADLSAIAGGDLSRLPALQTSARSIQSALAAFTDACPPA